MAVSTVHSLIIELRQLETAVRAGEVAGAVGRLQALEILRALQELLRRSGEWTTLERSDQDEVMAIAIQYAPYVAEGFQLRRQLEEELGVQIPDSRREQGYRSANDELPERPA
ncbi:hypothetical protein [Lysinibacter cavernae]|uniref:Uncharacterized protein n=1 Tax=Lysinibacter cavernae TaxID=1640652 RepID=A0A7X5TTU5_9MICO|nr:hypothetical protein [Lysinibacter cavernae]NIH53663.1 hypothetical protein [Lysinibacter cavernae]